jgi:protein-tyrosine phosphatase
MIDIHHHCLPGVDDGPRALSEAVDLCRMSEDEGIEAIVATPHVLRGRWKNTSREQMTAILDELRSKIGQRPRIVLGSEYFFAHDMDEMLRNQSILPLAGGRYVLVEFDAHSVPPLVREALYRVQLDGWTPVIAHPERNIVFRAKPALLASLIRAGVKTQVTTGSILGDFGPEAQASAVEWVKRGWVHVFATDAHNRAKRPPRFRAARERVRDLVGETTAEALFSGNPKSILDNVGLVYDPDIPEQLGKESGGIFHRMRRFFTK